MNLDADEGTLGAFERQGRPGLSIPELSGWQLVAAGPGRKVISRLCPDPLRTEFRRKASAKVRYRACREVLVSSQRDALIGRCVRIKVVPC